MFFGFFPRNNERTNEMSPSVSWQKTWNDERTHPYAIHQWEHTPLPGAGIVLWYEWTVYEQAFIALVFTQMRGMLWWWWSMSTYLKKKEEKKDDKCVDNSEQKRTIRPNSRTSGDNWPRISCLMFNNVIWIIGIGWYHWKAC